MRVAERGLSGGYGIGPSARRSKRPSPSIERDSDRVREVRGRRAAPRRDEGIDQVASLVARFEEAVADLVTASLDDPALLEAAISESELRLRALEAARAEVERFDRPETG